MAGKRDDYDDSCGIARALDLVGERWALLVVRELVHGPKRFTDLRAGLPGYQRRCADPAASRSASGRSRDAPQNFHAAGSGARV